MLFKTITELRPYVNVTEGLNIETITPDINRVEENVLTRFISQEQYDELLFEYQADPDDLSGMEGRLRDLLFKVRPAAALLAVFQSAGIISVQISDSGMQAHSSDSFKQAAAYMKNDARAYLAQYGYAAVDSLLSFMEKNKGDYPLWTNSSAYAQNKRFIVNTVDVFNSHYNIGDSWLTFRAMTSMMKRVEDFQITPSISSGLYNQIKGQIAENDLNADNHVLMQWLEPAATLFTVASALDELHLVITDSGILLNYFKAFQNDAYNERQPADAGQITKVQNKCRAEAATYLKLCVDYLRANASETKYTEFFNSNQFTKSDFVPYRNDPADKIIGFF